MPEIIYLVSKRHSELCQAMDAKIAEHTAITDKYPEGRSMSDEDKALCKEKLAKIAELRELKNQEEELCKARAELRAAKEAEGCSLQEPMRPAGDDNQNDNYVAFAPDTRGQPMQVRYPTPPERRFEGFGEFLSAVVRAGMPGGAVDKRLQWSEFETRTPSGQSTTIPSEGGFLIQPEYSAQLLARAYETGRLAPLCNRVRLGPNSSGIRLRLVHEDSRANGYRHGGVRMYRVEESGTVSSSKLKFRKFALDLEKAMGIYYATDEILRDPPALAAIATDYFTRELGFMMDTEIYDGTGVGQCLGISKSSARVSVAKESGQPAKTILFQNVLKMWARLWNPSVDGAVWCINQDTLPSLFTMNTTDGLGGVPVYLPSSALNQGAVGRPTAGTLLGSPVLRIEQAETLGTAGDIRLCDFGEYMLIDKEDMRTDSSIHVRFLYDEMTLRFIYRFNGAPLWDTALTPYKGTNTVSPFVELAARA